MLLQFASQHRLGKGFIHDATTWYVPLAERILLHFKRAKRPVMVGINGCQGSGKTTFCAFVADYLRQNHAVNVLCLSLDDFYFSHARRQHLAASIHPLLQTRGVPGTHDTVELAAVLEQVRQQASSFSVPRFNKATDNPAVSQPIDGPVDILLFEGWCWGVPAQDEASLLKPINALEAQEDSDGRWRHYVNQQLASHYLPLYAFMDMWLMLRAPSFAQVFAWRLEQEHKLRDATSGAGDGLMNDVQLARFIQHYQRLTERSLAALPARCDWVLMLDEQRRVTRCLPGGGNG
ncbi:P-loop NTPase fold protein [Bowmanella sp. JS7-9]|uniref:P-loop NTPase fold protein n=1 Tax=Pseudobowmanella zhangzhouensis TaxID=1537679 RepID=A0ABW1XH87_9ALTE|nr:P-loop NTPase fold protein [Bowmanella sp. JS7-9]TBX21068.1 kinase [Bowmanella sp. JS7-9]